MGSHRPIHPDPRLDVYLGNMIANRGCEPGPRNDETFTLVCGCPQHHLAIVRLHPDGAGDYAARTIREIEVAFTCC